MPSCSLIVIVRMCKKVLSTKSIIFNFFYHVYRLEHLYYETVLSSCSSKVFMATLIRIGVSQAHVGTLTELVVLSVSQMPCCHPTATQHVTVVQCSRLKSFRSINHKAQMFPRSRLRESVTCPVKDAASSMLANTWLYSCSASGSDSLHPHNFRKEVFENTIQQ